MAKTRFEFDYTPWCKSHTRQPQGRGSWGFAAAERPDVALFSPGGMTLAEAREWAKRQDWLVPQEWVDAGHAVVLLVLP